MADLYSNRFPPRGKRRGLITQPLIEYNTRSGRTLFTSRTLFDDKPAKPSAKDSHRNALREAVNFAQMAEHEELYINRARETGSTAYNIAIVDWLGAPRVLEIKVDGWTGKPGETIQVKARDNVAVVGVSVVIRDAQNNVLEAGEATLSKPGSAWWNYTTQAVVPMKPFPSVEATAQDLPGNTDTFVVS